MRYRAVSRGEVLVKLHSFCIWMASDTAPTTRKLQQQVLKHTQTHRFPFKNCPVEFCLPSVFGTQAQGLGHSCHPRAASAIPPVQADMAHAQRISKESAFPSLTSFIWEPAMTQLSHTADKQLQITAPGNFTADFIAQTYSFPKNIKFHNY